MVLIRSALWRNKKKNYLIPPLIWSFGVLESTFKHSKCPKISYTKVSEKMAYTNSADSDQTASICDFTKYINPSPAKPRYVLSLQTV